MCRYERVVTGYVGMMARRPVMLVMVMDILADTGAGARAGARAGALTSNWVILITIYAGLQSRG